MSDVYVIGTDMIRFGRYPADRSVEDLGAEAALLALKDAGLGIRDMQALYCGNVGEANRERWSARHAASGPDRDCGGQHGQCLRDGSHSVPGGMDCDQIGLYDLILCIGVEKMGRGLLGGGASYAGVPTEGLVGRDDAIDVCLARHGAYPQIRHHLRAVRKGVGEEPSPLDDERKSDVPRGDPARAGHGSGNDFLSSD